jgi:hypothetical protein
LCASRNLASVAQKHIGHYAETARARLFFYIKFGRSGMFTAGNDIRDFLQAAMAKDDIARPRNPVIFLQSSCNRR